MSYKEREGAILEYLREKKQATVNELCGALFVSEPTMRRDLSLLNKAGRIIRTHGGAAYKSEPGENIPQAYREREHTEAKAVIGRKCLSLINDGDTVMIDGSSTAFELMKLLRAKSNIIVITNSAQAAIALSDTSVKTLVTGGELAPNSYAYVGGHAEEYLREFSADVCFFSVRTLTESGELTDNAIAENRIRRAMMARSRRSVVMLDSEKIGAPCINTLCHLDDVSFVVCEKDISDMFPGYSERFI